MKYINDYLKAKPTQRQQASETLKRAVREHFYTKRVELKQQCMLRKAARGKK